MAATIIYLVISLLVSLIFIILGVRQYKAEKPVSINTGEKPPHEDELTSVTEWNHRHGRNFIIFGCVLFITLAVFAYFIEKQDSIALQVVILLIIIFVEIAWVELQHNMMKKKMIKNRRLLVYRTRESGFTEEIQMKQYIVDAFTDKIFHGNQAAICIMDQWITEDLMMNITKENNFSETAFAVKEGEKYHLRWFTPGGEIDLCGHATLACAYVLFKFYITDANKVVFSTLSGDLIVKRNDDLLEMEFPAYKLEKVPVTQDMIDAMGATPSEAYMGRDLLCVFDDEKTVRNLQPDMNKLLNLEGLLLQVTAPGKDTDSVSRSFAPKLNVTEDPVCGSGHCHIVPYWAKRLNKDSIVAYQASKRGGTLYCRMDGDKVFLAGKAALFSECEIYI